MLKYDNLGSQVRKDKERGKKSGGNGEGENKRNKMIQRAKNTDRWTSKTESWQQKKWNILHLFLSLFHKKCLLSGTGIFKIITNILQMRSGMFRLHSYWATKTSASSFQRWCSTFVVELSVWATINVCSSVLLLCLC